MAIALFDRLPNELIVKIYLCLKCDLYSIKNLWATCKRFNYIARNLLVKESEWNLSRSVPLSPPSFRTDFVSYSTLVDHLAGVKHVPYNTITFSYTNLRISNGLGGDQLPQDALHSLSKFYSIVELRLINCRTTSIWLTTVLNNLPNIAYLTLNETTVLVDAQKPDVIFKQLKELRILHDKSFDDALLFNLFSNLPPALLDFTGTFIACDRRVKQRYYGPETALDHSSDLVLTLYRIASFMELHKATLAQLILDGTAINDEDLLDLVRHESFPHLRISAMRCPQLTKKSLALIESSDLRHRIKASA